MQSGTPLASHQRFHLKTLEQLRAELDRLGLDLPLSGDLSTLFDGVRIGELRTANRFAVHPMEGFDSEPDGAPGTLTFRRYERYAAGGSGLIWFEATAVLNEARSNPGQLFLHRGNVDAFARLVELTRQTARQAQGRELVLILQLTHSGRYSRPAGVPEPIIAHHSPILDPKLGLPEDYPLVTDEYLDRLQESFVGAARLAAQAGFDGVDLKGCHRYIISELLASHTRPGRYGGSFENRTRMLRETLQRIAREVPVIFVATRLNVYDAISYPYGWGVDRNDWHVPELAEPLKLVGLLRRIGVPILNVSIGNPYYNPHVGRPFDFPVAGAYAPEEHPLVGIARFVHITRQIQQSIPDVPVIGGGYAWLRHLMPYAAAGVAKAGWATLIGQGRGAFAYPDSVSDLDRRGEMDPRKCCVTCSGCTQIMRDGAMAGCVVRDSAIYGPQYRLGRRFAVDRLQAEARRCRDCEIPTCQEGCPAHVDIPAFIKAFADGDIRTAYDFLRRNNVLPEMCGYICPSEVQCEGGCVEKVFCERPIPIRDIQLVACRAARLKGLLGVRLPQRASGRRAAIVGGGPTGLACAIRLLELGHSVAIFERSSKLGGMPDSIIPGTRYGDAAAEIDAILAPAQQAGRVTVELGQALGEQLRLEQLQKDFDAVFLAVGLTQSVSLGTAEGVLDALRFLRDAKGGTLKSVPARVAVLGGGNTAMDAAVTARRLGARDVYVVYRRSFAEMPAWPEQRSRFLDSGGHLLILTQPLGYVTGKDGKLTALRIARTELGEPDQSGRRRPILVPNSEGLLTVDLVIEAIGQELSEPLRAALKAIKLSGDGLVQTAAESSATSLERVFAGGDIVNGGTTAVRGVAEGMRAAQEIDAALHQ